MKYIAYGGSPTRKFVPPAGHHSYRSFADTALDRPALRTYPAQVMSSRVRSIFSRRLHLSRGEHLEFQRPGLADIIEMKASRYGTERKATFIDEFMSDVGEYDSRQGGADE